MTAERWLARRMVAVLLITALVGLGLIAGIDGIERSRLLGPGGDGLDLAALVGWRLPGLARELVPVWSAVSAALLAGGLQRSGAWEALQGAGVARARSLAVLVAVTGGLCGSTAAALEVLVPVATLRAAAAEGRLSGHAAGLAGGWVRLGDQAFRVGGALDGALIDVVSMGRVDGRLERRVADRVTWDGQTWRGAVLVQGTGAPPEARDHLDLPPPAAMAALVRPRATSEAGLGVLADIPVPGADGWWHRRLAGLVSPGLMALLGLGLALRPRPGLAAAVALSALGAGAAHLGIAVLAEAVGAVGVWGAWAAAAALGAYLVVSTR